MLAAAQRDTRSILAGILASLALHAAFALALLLSPAVQRLRPINEVEVEIVSSQPPTPISASKSEPQAQPDIPKPAIDARPVSPDQNSALPNGETSMQKPRTTVKPTNMLSAAVLDNPASQKARKALSRLAGDERVVQLCNIEAMAQVAAWNNAFKPDFVVAYAMADTKFSRNILLAEGAAFHSDQQWYHISYQCNVATDHKSVAAFEFLVGDPVPASEWGRHNLPTRIAPID
jgi:hypothetical protein